MNSRFFRRAIKAEQGHFIGREHLDSAAASGRPVIVILWHHGISRLHEFVQQAHPGAVIVTTANFLRPSTIMVDGLQSPFALIKIRDLLCRQKKILVWAFDGPEGNHCVPAYLFGSQLLLGRGYPALAKLINPIIIPFTHYLGPDGAPQFFWGKPLFNDQELSQLTEQQILEKTIAYFIHDLIAKGPYHVNLQDLFQRFCRDSGIVRLA